MAEIINLNKHRKAAVRGAAERQAAVNRASHGRGKAEKERDRAEEARRQALLDGARRAEDPSGETGAEPAPPGPPPQAR